MKKALPAAYFKNWFNRVSKCTITQDICSHLLGLLYTSVATRSSDNFFGEQDSGKKLTSKYHFLP